MNIRLITAFWGRDFVDMFLRVGLPSLLAEGNLPDLARAHRVIFTIYTTAEDAEDLREDPAFSRLCQIVDARLSLFSLTEIDAGNPGSHGVMWLRGLEAAKRNREVLFLIVPDLLYARGTLERWAKRFDEGYRAIYTPGPFVTLETILPELETRFPRGQGDISLSSDDILDLLARHIHPLETAMLRDAPRRCFHPEHDIRPLERRGFVMRVFTSQPFCIDPGYFSEVNLFNPQDHLDRICMEACSTLSVEPIFKGASWHYRPKALDSNLISQLGVWWSFFAIGGCLVESAATYDFCFHNDAEWEKSRARAVSGGRFLRVQILTGMKIFRVWHELARLGYFWPAAILASAYYAGNLRRHLSVPKNAIFLVPNNEVFEQASSNWIWDLLRPGRERDLVRLIKEHIVIPAKGATSMADWRTANRTPVSDFAINGIVVGEPLRVDDMTLYIIDRAIPANSPEESSAEAEPEKIPAPFHPWIRRSTELADSPEESSAEAEPEKIPAPFHPWIRRSTELADSPEESSAEAEPEKIPAALDEGEGPQSAEQTAPLAGRASRSVPEYANSVLRRIQGWKGAARRMLGRMYRKYFSIKRLYRKLNGIRLGISQRFYPAIRDLQQALADMISGVATRFRFLFRQALADMISGVATRFRFLFRRICHWSKVIPPLHRILRRVDRAIDLAPSVGWLELLRIVVRRNAVLVLCVHYVLAVPRAFFRGVG